MTRARLDRLLALTLELLFERRETHPEFDLAIQHQLGICYPAAEYAEQAARRLGITAKLRTGSVRCASGRVVPNHAWLELSRGLILDSPSADHIMLATAQDRGAEYRPA